MDQLQQSYPTSQRLEALQAELSEIRRRRINSLSNATASLRTTRRRHVLEASNTYDSRDAAYMRPNGDAMKKVSNANNVDSGAVHIRPREDIVTEDIRKHAVSWFSSSQQAHQMSAASPTIGGSGSISIAALHPPETQYSPNLNRSAAPWPVESPRSLMMPVNDRHSFESAKIDVETEASSRMASAMAQCAYCGVMMSTAELLQHVPQCPSRRDTKTATSYSTLADEPMQTGHTLQPQRQQRVSELQRWLTDFGLGGVTGQLLDLGYESLQQIHELKGSERDKLMSKLHLTPVVERQLRAAISFGLNGDVSKTVSNMAHLKESSTPTEHADNNQNTSPTETEGSELTSWLALHELSQYVGSLAQLGHKTVPSFLDLSSTKLEELGVELLMPPGHYFRFRAAIEQERLVPLDHEVPLDPEMQKTTVRDPQVETTVRGPTVEGDGATAPKPSVVDPSTSQIQTTDVKNLPAEVNSSLGPLLGPFEHGAPNDRRDEGENRLPSDVGDKDRGLHQNEILVLRAQIDGAAGQLGSISAAWDRLISDQLLREAKIRTECDDCIREYH
eukprot:SAG31_NODE_2467_length_5652_cov_3.221862_6_plen_561_part_00